MRRLAAALAGLVLAATPALAETLAIVHARAWTMDRPGPLDDATILVADGLIVSVAAHVPAPAGARVLDAAGAMVTPGLMSGATQLGLIEVSGADDTLDGAVATGPLGAAFDIAPALNANSALIPIARADGLTRAMSYPSGTAVAPFLGQGALIVLNESGSILERPRAAVFAAVGEGTAARAGGSRAAQWDLLREALGEARLAAPAAEAPWPAGRLVSRLDARALAPVLSGAAPLAIFAQRQSDIAQAIALAADAHIRVVVLGGAEAWRLAPQLAAAHIPVVLDPQANLPQTFDLIGARLDNAALLAAAGVELAFSVSGNGIYLSYDAGEALREGAGLAVANGLPYAAALAAITRAPAHVWGVGDRHGQIAPGFDADLVIWDGDPLEPASAPVAVFVRGVRADLATRQTRLRDRYAPAAAGPLPSAYR